MINLKTKTEAIRLLKALEVCSHTDSSGLPIDCISIKYITETSLELVTTDAHILLKLSLSPSQDNWDLLRIGIQDRYKLDIGLELNNKVISWRHSKDRYFAGDSYPKYDHLIQSKNNAAKTDDFLLKGCNIHYLSIIAQLYTFLKIDKYFFEPDYQNGKHKPLIQEPMNGVYIMLMPLHP